jgi:hypothetical protein
LNIRSEKAPTPEERIAAKVRELIVESYNKERHYPGTCFPNVPDHADITEALRPYVLREILRAQLDMCMKFGTFQEGLGIMEELNKVNLEIAKREHPTK